MFVCNKTAVMGNRAIKCRSYKDIVSLDYSEKVFYIYSLGRYHNKPLYHYGETLNPETLEFELAKTLPYYKKIVHVPVDTCVDGKDKFELFVKKNELSTQLPLRFSNGILIDVIQTTDDYDIKRILDEVHLAFKQPISFSRVAN